MGLVGEPHGAGDGAQLAPLAAQPGQEAGGGTGRKREEGGGGMVRDCLLEGIKGSILSQEKEIKIKSASSACWKTGQDLWLGRGGLGHPVASPDGPGG